MNGLTVECNYDCYLTGFAAMQSSNNIKYNLLLSLYVNGD